MTPTYFGMESFLGGRDFRAVPSIRSTSVERIDEATIGLRYHNTFVVIYNAAGHVTLHTGGHYSVITKSRINDFSPARVWQEKFVWYVSAGASKVKFTEGVEIDEVTGKPYQPATHDESVSL